MNEYASHLSNLKNKTTVTATKDILTDKGVLLARSGIEITPKVCENILRFKLLKPLEDSISIEDQLDARSTFQQINKMIYEDPWLKEINDRLGDKTVLQCCCLQAEKHSLLMQKLTVLQLEMNDVFHQSILSAYFACIYGVYKKLTREEIANYFIAGLTHDMGLLHIDRYIFSKKETLTAEEWRKIQSHPIIGYEILKRVPNLPKAIAKAVLEHHENLDGSGYPRGKTAHNISQLGQLINILDNVIVIYKKKFKPLHRSIHGVIPILQMSAHSYYPTVSSPVIQILKEASSSPVEQSEAVIVKELILHVKAKQTYIERIMLEIKQANQDIGFGHGNNQLFAIQNIANNISHIISSAGLADSRYITCWLQDLEDSGHQLLYNDVEDTRVMLGEVIYQLQGYQKTVSVFINQNPDHEACIILNESIDVFATTQQPKTPSAIEQYWKELTQENAPSSLKAG